MSDDFLAFAVEAFEQLKNNAPLLQDVPDFVYASSDWVDQALKKNYLEPTDELGKYKILPPSMFAGKYVWRESHSCSHPYPMWHDEWMMSLPPKLKQRRCGLCGATTQDRNAWKDKRYAI